MLCSLRQCAGLPRPAFLLLFACLALCLRAETSVFPAVDSDQQADPALVRGVLPNGFSYMILPNQEPKKRISMRLVVGVGSMHETDEQRGFAHFVEHMAFRGTEKYPGDSLSKLLERKGISTEGDNNAITAYRYTLYSLVLPDDAQEMLKLGLDVFHEYATAVTFDKAALEIERGVIQSEKELRGDPSYQVYQSKIKFLWPNSRYSNRSPIGLMPTIKSCSARQLRRFYRTWYRPERMGIVVVGNVNPQETLAAIKEAFGSFTVSGGPPAEPTDMEPKILSKPDVAVYRDDSFVGVSILMEHASPYKRRADTRANRVEWLQSYVAAFVFQMRLDKIYRANKGGFISPRVNTGYEVEGWQESVISVGSSLNQWKKAAGDLELERYRAMRFGFNPQELEKAKATLKTGYHYAVTSAPTRLSGVLSSELVSCMLGGYNFLRPETIEADMATAVDQLSLEDCKKGFRREWGTSAPHVFVTMTRQGVIRRDELAAVLNASRPDDIKPLADTEALTFAYTRFGPDGKLVKNQLIEDVDIRLTEFENKVRLNFKHTDFEADQIDILVRVGSGRTSQPPDKPGLNIVADVVLSQGGLGKHSASDVQDLLAGHSVSLRFDTRMDGFYLMAACSRKDLLFCLQMLAAYLSDPGFRPESMVEANATLGSIYSSLMGSPGGPINARAMRILAGGDCRVGIAEVAESYSRTYAEVVEWLEPQIKRGCIEMSVVGDVGWEDALSAVSKTIGALPRRDDHPLEQIDSGLSFKVQQSNPMIFALPASFNQLALMVIWPVEDVGDIHLERRCHLLSDLLEDRLRLRLREELGAAYAPSISYYAENNSKNFGLFSVYAEMPPSKLSAAISCIRKEIADFGAGRISQESFERVRQPFLRSRTDDLRSNGYWGYTVMKDIQLVPGRIEACRDRQADCASISLQEMKDLAVRYFATPNASTFIAVPASNMPFMSSVPTITGSIRR